jgi:hypothetical protein
MGMGTMFLWEAAEANDTTVLRLATEAREGHLALHRLPACAKCDAAEGQPCEPSCEDAGTQIVWLGDWYRWFKGANR